MDGKQNVLNKQAILMHKDKIRVSITYHSTVAQCFQRSMPFCCNARQTILIVKIRIDKDFFNFNLHSDFSRTNLLLFSKQNLPKAADLFKV